MSESITIYVDPKQPLGEFMGELERLLRLSFQRDIDPAFHDITYRFTDEQSRMWAYERDIDDEDDSPYEKYPYVIAIEARRFKEPDEMLALQKKLGYQVFETLKATGKYRLLLFWDSQVLLEKFDPAVGEERKPSGTDDMTNPA